MDLNQYKDKEIRVKFIGGRQIIGVLKGFDQLMNLVLENVKENIRGMFYNGQLEYYAINWLVIY